MQMLRKNHRTAILDAAQGVVLTKGFASTRIDEICETAGVTEGSFFNYFISKYAVAEATLTTMFKM